MAATMGNKNTKEAMKMKGLNNLWREFLKQNPANDDLRYIIRWIKPLREKTWQKLLEHGPDEYDLHYIIRRVKPLRKKAARLLP